MKLFLFLGLWAVAAGARIAPEKKRVSGEGGWFIPREDGSFYWLDREKAKIHSKLTSEVKDGSVQFYLYTSKNPDKAQQIDSTKDSIDASNFNARNPSTIIVHGWTGSHNDFVNNDIRKAWLSLGEYNIISVDWARGRSLDYASSVWAAKDAGRFAAAFVDDLVRNNDLNLDTLEIVGYSLGAHMAGFIGKYLESGKAHAIVGLDPALPLFSYDKPQSHLCNTDAKYVESIQTNGGNLGFLQPIGNSAFYPNGGRFQPGCGFDLFGYCAHSRSVTYYIEALYHNNFATISCQNYEQAVAGNCGSNYSDVRMGFFGRFSKEAGVYYVPVKSESPFGDLN